ncbi:MAG TPA: hypothetical protein VN829_03240 [Dongiaceae bacterium]|nr:hypothetical protein [Dongiaceae bacterium]
MSNFCTDCFYCQKTGHLVISLPKKPSDSWLCTQNATARDPVSGIAVGPDMIACIYARQEGRPCGPDGKLFKKKA